MHPLIGFLPRGLVFCALFLLSACGQAGEGSGPAGFATPYPLEGNLKRAHFAGGCFWCMEPPFEKADGVVSVLSGYMGGGEPRPTYEAVSAARTGHRESVEVTYDPARISYNKLLDIFWRSIDPTQADGQFADRGPQYKTAIFYAGEEEKSLAEASKQALGDSGRFKKPIVVEILPATEFFPAEEYHQDYYKKNPAHYNAYRVGSGRAGFLKATWGDEGGH